jgi:hypothetical protein
MHNPFRTAVSMLLYKVKHHTCKGIFALVMLLFLTSFFITMILFSRDPNKWHPLYYIFSGRPEHFNRERETRRRGQRAPTSGQMSGAS